MTTVTSLRNSEARTLARIESRHLHAAERFLSTVLPLELRRDLTIGSPTRRTVAVLDDQRPGILLDDDFDETRLPVSQLAGFVFPVSGPRTYGTTRAAVRTGPKLFDTDPLGARTPLRYEDLTPEHATTVSFDAHRVDAISLVGFRIEGVQDVTHRGTTPYLHRPVSVEEFSALIDPTDPASRELYVSLVTG